jgi:UDP-GlcNAc:undecaprenyl-phosphate GlcNAc-1-phosphate transferase
MVWLAVYGGIFVAAALLSVLLCGGARAMGLKLGWMDIPAGRKAHRAPIAVTGGYGIFLSFAACVLGGTLLATWLAGHLPERLGNLAHYLQNLSGVRREIFSVLGGAGWLFLVGAIDDRHPLGPKVKLLAQALAVIPLLWAGIMIRSFLPNWVGAGLTLFWVLLLTNAFNLLDNMDGLSASVALVVCGVMALAAWQGGQLWMPALFLCLAGVLLGFLVYNFNPASLFMGDAGSLSMGYLCAVFSVLTTYWNPGTHTSLPVLMPLAIMAVPLFDTLSVMFIRHRHGAPLFVGDRNHFSHRLLKMGFSVREAALTIALLTGASGLLALPLRSLELSSALIHLGGLAMLFAVIIALEIVGRREQS